MLKGFFGCVCLVTALLGAPALAGSPDSPGAAGEIVSGLTKADPDFGKNTADLARAGNVPGRNLQGFADTAGGFPEPHQRQRARERRTCPYARTLTVDKGPGGAGVFTPWTGVRGR